MTKLRLRRHLRVFVLFGIATCLTWQVVTQSFAAYLAEVAPQAALWLHPRQSSALINLAEEALNASDRNAAESTGLANDKSDRSDNGNDDLKRAPNKSGRYKENLDNAFGAFKTVGENQTVNRQVGS